MAAVVVKTFGGYQLQERAELLAVVAQVVWWTPKRLLLVHFLKLLLLVLVALVQLQMAQRLATVVIQQLQVLQPQLAVVVADHTKLNLAALHITLTTHLAVDQAAVPLMDILEKLAQLTKVILALLGEGVFPTVAVAVAARVPQAPLVTLVVTELAALDQTSTLLGHLQQVRAIQDILQAVAVVAVVNQTHRERVEMAVEETVIMVLEQQILGVVEQEIVTVQVVLVALA